MCLIVDVVWYLRDTTNQSRVAWVLPTSSGGYAHGGFDFIQRSKHNAPSFVPLIDEPPVSWVQPTLQTAARSQPTTNCAGALVASSSLKPITDAFGLRKLWVENFLF